MTDIRVGDTIKATRNDSPTETAIGVVCAVSEMRVITGSFTLYRAKWDITVTDRAYTLPTEPGLYTPTKIQRDLVYTRIFHRGDEGVWTELTGNKDTATDDPETLFRKHKWELQPLVIKDAE